VCSTKASVAELRQRKYSIILKCIDGDLAGGDIKEQGANGKAERAVFTV